MKPTAITSTHSNPNTVASSSGASASHVRSISKAPADLYHTSLPICPPTLEAELEKLSLNTSTVAARYISKMDTATNQAPLLHSRIQTEQGQTYELLNTLNKHDTMAVVIQHQQKWLGKTTIAQGGYGKVRFARNTNTNEIVAVKKMASPVDEQGNVQNSKPRAEHEIAQMQLIKNRIAAQQAWHMQNEFALLQDHAHIEKPRNANKTYIFSEFANLVDGCEAVGRLNNQLLLHIARSYAKAVMHLHQLDLHHRDIKPDNFLHYETTQHDGLEAIRLTDFGFTQDAELRNTWTDETPQYSPPEAKPAYRSTRYDAQAHDCFSLGITLLALKNKEYAFQNPEHPHLTLKTLDGKTHAVQLRFYRNLGEPRGQNARCHGVSTELLHNLDMAHFDNIIAKLIATHKADRISAEQAFGLLSQLE